MPTAQELKDQGNRAFGNQEYEEAEYFYSQAIIKDPQSHKLFTNRARARLRLGRPEGALADAGTATSLAPTWMKGHYLSADANIALRRPHEAVRAAHAAYDLCVRFPRDYGRDALDACDLVLRAKKALWEAAERERVRGRSALLDDCLDAVRQARDRRRADVDAEAAAGGIGPASADEERRAADQEAEQKERDLMRVFAAEDPELGMREVPDCFIDQISFNFMIDPVVTKYGHSYERAHIMRHIEHNPTDPLTGEHMTIKDLRPNLALRDACEEFLKKNGWAADY